MFANRWEEEAAIALIKEKKPKAAAKVVEDTKKRGAELMKKYLEAVPKAMKRVADLKKQCCCTTVSIDRIGRTKNTPNFNDWSYRTVGRWGM